MNDHDVANMLLMLHFGKRLSRCSSCMCTGKFGLGAGQSVITVSYSINTHMIQSCRGDPVVHAFRFVLLRLGLVLFFIGQAINSTITICWHSCAVPRKQPPNLETERAFQKEVFSRVPAAPIFLVRS